MNLTEIKNIKIESFDYPLPDNRVARHPLPVRDECKLLLSRPDGNTGHFTFRQLPGLLPPASLMICNNTRVINARIKFQKESGAQIEVFLLEPVNPSDYVLAFQQRNNCEWLCMVGNSKRWKSGTLTKKLNISGKDTILSIRRKAQPNGASQIISFEWDNPEATWATIVETAGYIPIPPYLNRESEKSDEDDYQTVYSEIEGSVAAPTAGLHFTDRIIDDLRAHNIDLDSVTLHVGAGTFQPVKSETIGEHPMHTETFSITRLTIENLINALKTHRPVTAVGTTSVRTLESLPYLGLALSRNKAPHVNQWDAYMPENNNIDTIATLTYLLDYLKENHLSSLTASTAIMIAPGFKWRIVDAMVTNFHQPQSTLLLLVSSFLEGSGSTSSKSIPHWQKLYNEALNLDYRFLSYGDASLVFPLIDNSSRKIR